MGTERWQPSADEIMSAIEAESRRHRSDCRAFVAEFASMYAVDRSPVELDEAWSSLVGDYPWYAEDLLFCVAALLNDRDTPMPALVVEVAEMESDPPGPGGDEGGRRWLSDLQQRFTAVFEDLSAR